MHRIYINNNGGNFSKLNACGLHFYLDFCVQRRDAHGKLSVARVSTSWRRSVKQCGLFLSLRAVSRCTTVDAWERLSEGEGAKVEKFARRSKLQQLASEEDKRKKKHGKAAKSWSAGISAEFGQYLVQSVSRTWKRWGGQWDGGGEVATIWCQLVALWRCSFKVGSTRKARRPTLTSDRHYCFGKNPLTTQNQSLKDIWDAHYLLIRANRHTW